MTEMNARNLLEYQNQQLLIESYKRELELREKQVAILTKGLKDVEVALKGDKKK